MTSLQRGTTRDDEHRWSSGGVWYTAPWGRHRDHGRGMSFGEPCSGVVVGAASGL